MELKITEDKENKLFNRREVKGVVESNATPSRPDMTKLLSEKFSVPSENIKIKQIKGKFGARIFDIEANIYSSKEEKDSIELKKKKDAEAEKSAVEEKPAEETQSQPEKKEETKQEQEKKPEEVKEEKKEEEIEEGPKEEEKKEENNQEPQ